ncbi:MAG: hypothetical protein ACYCYO_04760, partial [Bacilli bacterium]
MLSHLCDAAQDLREKWIQEELLDRIWNQQPNRLGTLLDQAARNRVRMLIEFFHNKAHPFPRLRADPR